jgi:hypothetical protein
MVAGPGSRVGRLGLALGGERGSGDIYCICRMYDTGSCRICAISRIPIFPKRIKLRPTSYDDDVTGGRRFMWTRTKLIGAH